MARPGLLAALLLSTALVQLPAAAASQPAQSEAVRTLTGIALDAPWKVKIYGFAREKLLHPAWGWTHSERNFHLANEVAAKERLAVDSDVLSAAAFTHDIGAIGEFQKEGVDHAARSVEIAEPLLREAGFPMEKMPATRDAILGHMHDKRPGKGHEAIALHDADTLDFLGMIGVARRLAVTGTASDMSGGVGRIREFADKLPARLVTNTAKKMAVPRVVEMRRFLDHSMRKLLMAASPDPAEVRRAGPRDAAATAAIYAHHVAHGTASFDTEPRSGAEMAAKIAECWDRGWPFLVAEVGGEVIGYAFATQFRDRPAYTSTCENSIYLHPDHCGQGVGTSPSRRLGRGGRASRLPPDDRSGRRGRTCLRGSPFEGGICRGRANAIGRAQVRPLARHPLYGRSHSGPATRSRRKSSHERATTKAAGGGRDRLLLPVRDRDRLGRDGRGPGRRERRDRPARQHACNWGNPVRPDHHARPGLGPAFYLAVSLVMVGRGELSWRDALPYIVAQMIGGLLGAWAAHLMFDLPILQYSLKARTGIGQ